jgi:hypothetical protein
MMMATHTVVYRHEAQDMADAHAEGLHAELPREFCPECEGRDLASYPVQPQRSNNKQVSISAIENAINVALLVWGHDNEKLRRVLLTARGDIREALGEART